MKKQALVIPADSPILDFLTAQAFDMRLERHGSTTPGIHICIAKKDSGVRSITYAEAADTALYHGWIDGVRRANDGKTILQRFTRRGPRSIWSEINKEKVKQLVKAELMRPAGLAAVKQAKAIGQWEMAYAPVSITQVPPGLAAALKKNKKARAFFETLTGSGRFAFLHRLHSAKKEETRTKRLALFIAMMERGGSCHQ